VRAPPEREFYAYYSELKSTLIIMPWFILHREVSLAVSMQIDGIRGGAPDFHSYAIASRVIKVITHGGGDHQAG